MRGAKKRNSGTTSEFAQFSLADTFDGPTLVVPSQLDFMLGPQGDFESMIWVLTCVVILRHQESLRGSVKARYKPKVVDRLYGSLSYSGLTDIMVFRGSNTFYDEPEEWIPNPVQRKWFRRAMWLLFSQIMPSLDGSITVITFDTFDAFCDEFITDE
jgi:hypothetical protein